MKIVGCDPTCRTTKALPCSIHVRVLYMYVVDTETGEMTEKVLKHEGDAVRNSYASLEGEVMVGIEATGSMPWFVESLEELGIGC